MGSSGFNVGGYSGGSNNPTKIDLNINNNFVGPVQFDANNPLGIDQIDVNILSDIKKYDYGQADIEEFDFTDDKKPYDELFNFRYDLKYTYESIQEELDNLEKEYNTLTGKIYHAPHTDEDLKRKEELENKISTLKGYLAEINEMSMDYVKITNIKNKKQYIKSLKDEKKKYLELLDKNISDNDRAYYSELLAKVNEKLSIYEKVNADYADLMKRISNLVSEYNSLKYDDVENFIDDTKIEDMPDYNKDDVSVETPTVLTSISVPSGTGNYDFSDIHRPMNSVEELYPSWDDNYDSDHKWAFNLYTSKKEWWIQRCIEKGINPDEIVGISQNEPYDISPKDYYGNRNYGAHGTIPQEVLNGKFYANEKLTAIDIILDACQYYDVKPEDIMALWLHEGNCGQADQLSVKGPNMFSFGLSPEKFNVEWAKFTTGVTDEYNPAQAIWGIVSIFAAKKRLFDGSNDRQARSNTFACYAAGTGAFKKNGYAAVNVKGINMEFMVFNENPYDHQYGFMVLAEAIANNDLNKLSESVNNSVTPRDYSITFDENGNAFFELIAYDSSKIVK